MEDETTSEFLKKIGIEKLTDDQEKVFDMIFRGENVLLVSPTGSGKTEASILPVMERIRKDTKPKIHAIFITPLRALNRDIYDRLKKYGEKIGVKVSLRHGDSTDYERREMVENPPDILITTPETLQIMYSGKNLRKLLDSVKTVIIDEIHEMVRDERGWQLSLLIEKMERNNGKIQRIGLSATVGNEETISKYLSPNEEVKIIKNYNLKRMEIFVTAPEREYVDESEQMMTDVEYGSAIMTSMNLVNESRLSLIFVNTRFTAEDISMRLNKIGYGNTVGIHHGSLSREIRIQNEKLLKEGKLKALICTSSLELGIDIGEIDFIIQFNSPRQVYRLIQRIGRSGHRIDKVSRGTIVANDPLEIMEASSIIDMQRKGWVEDLSVRKNPIVVLANQIIMWTYTEKELYADELFSIIKKSYPFRDLEQNIFYNILNFLSEIKLIRFDGHSIKNGIKTLEYFYNNVSLIPDEKTYDVIESGTGKFIGTLDESFVSLEIYEGNTFVMKGTTWRVNEISGNRIYVDFVEDVGNVPRWIGEDIPVTYEVAQNAKRMMIENQIPDYLNESAREKLKNFYNKFEQYGKDILISRNGPDIIIVDWYGTRVNETLALYLSTMLRNMNYNVSFSVTPYSIIISSEDILISEKVIKDILTKDDNFDLIIRNGMRNNRIFLKTFLYVSKKFGIISKDADITSIKFEKILDAYSNTPIYEEAINKALFDYLDLERAREIIQSIKTNGQMISIIPYNDLFEIYLKYFERKTNRTKVTPTVLQAVKKRLENQELIFVCLNCKGTWTKKVADVNSYQCIYCGSVNISVIKRYDRDRLNILINGPKNKKEEEFLQKLRNTSNLIKIHRKEALLTLAGHGINHETAMRILRNPHSDVMYLIKDIVDAELNFSRNKKYWKL
mgnify:CR=1 FL=1